MFTVGFIWTPEDITSFLNDKDQFWKMEIYITKLASSLLKDGKEPIAVLNSIRQISC